MWREMLSQLRKQVGQLVSQQNVARVQIGGGFVRLRPEADTRAAECGPPWTGPIRTVRDL